jgi:hypothetical protein
MDANQVATLLSAAKTRADAVGNLFDALAP